MTELDLHASCDELVRIYEHVRRNVDVIAPFLPETAEIDIFAGRTSHSIKDIPLLGVYLPDDADSNGDVCNKLQDEIDEWVIEQDPDTLDLLLAEIDFPTWDHLVSIGTYPDRTATQHGG
ncbi:hypothetical protein [Novipirellula caenicola]